MIITYPTSRSGIINYCVIKNKQKILLDFADFALQEQLEDNLTLYDRMSDISDTTTINQILFSGFLIFSSQTSKVKATPVAILDFVIRSF